MLFSLISERRKSCENSFYSFFCCCCAFRLSLSPIPAELMQMAVTLITVQENTTIIMATPPTSIQMASARMIMMTRPATIPVHPLAIIRDISPLLLSILHTVMVMMMVIFAAIMMVMIAVLTMAMSKLLCKRMKHISLF